MGAKGGVYSQSPIVAAPSKPEAPEILREAVRRAVENHKRQQDKDCEQ